MELIASEYGTVNTPQYVSSFTRVMDSIAGLKYDLFKHYFLFDSEKVKCGILPIRVPGCTVGELRFNKDTMIITGGEVYPHAVIKYPESIVSAFSNIEGERIEIVGVQYE